MEAREEKASGSAEQAVLKDLEAGDLDGPARPHQVALDSESVRSVRFLDVCTDQVHGL